MAFRMRMAFKRLQMATMTLRRGFSAWTKGQRVRISDFNEAPQYNGLVGTLLTPPGEMQLCEVAVDKTSKVIKLNAKSISPVTESASSGETLKKDPLTKIFTRYSGLYNKEASILDQALEPTTCKVRTYLSKKRKMDSTMEIPLSATSIEVNRAVCHRTIPKSSIAQFIFKRLAKIQVEAANAPDEEEVDLCSLNALGRMGWLRLCERSDYVSSYVSDHPRDLLSNDPRENVKERSERTPLPRQEICVGRLVPSWGRQEPALYGSSDWHKFRWAWHDYPWVSKLVVMVSVAEIDVQEDSESAHRKLEVCTEMRLVCTSYLAHVLLQPTWWLLARPLCGIIHGGVTRNLRKLNKS